MRSRWKNRLIFLYKQISDGVTEKVNASPLSDLGLNKKS